VPGSGKSTLLLELASDLLERSERDDNIPIPVVLNLPSWVERRAPLAEWIIDELNSKRHNVPRHFAEHWVHHEQILPLLDGLDEVAAEDRAACVKSINEFRDEHGLLPIAVCSRLADYKALTEQLRFPGAVLIQLLTKSEIWEYLCRGGDPLTGLRTTLDSDPLWWEPSLCAKINETPSRPAFSVGGGEGNSYEDDGKYGK